MYGKQKPKVIYVFAKILFINSEVQFCLPFSNLYN